MMFTVYVLLRNRHETLRHEQRRHKFVLSSRVDPVGDQDDVQEWSQIVNIYMLYLVNIGTVPTYTYVAKYINIYNIILLFVYIYK